MLRALVVLVPADVVELTEPQLLARFLLPALPALPPASGVRLLRAIKERWSALRDHTHLVRQERCRSAGRRFVHISITSGTMVRVGAGGTTRTRHVPSRPAGRVGGARALPGFVLRRDGI